MHPLGQASGTCRARQAAPHPHNSTRRVSAHRPVGTHPAPEHRCPRRVSHAGTSLSGLLWNHNTPASMVKRKKRKTKHKTKPNQATKQHPTLPFQKVALMLLYSPPSKHDLFNRSSALLGCCGRQALAACHTATPPFAVTQTWGVNKHCIRVGLQQLIQ